MAETSVAIHANPGWFQIGQCQVLAPIRPDFSRDEVSRLDALLQEGDWSRVCKWMEQHLGSFAFYYQEEELVVAGVDAVASLPLYYSRDNNSLALADSLEYFVHEGMVAAPEVRAEIIMAGFVSGSDTLVAGVNQMLAGSCLVFEADTAGWRERRLDHTTFLPGRYGNDTMGEEECLQQCTEVFERVISQLLDRIGNRQVLLPLSGGLDSRALALMLKQAGKKNVLCYTYGKEGNRESAISREVAEALGFPWEFVPYSKKSWQDWEQQADTQAWLRDNFWTCSSVPHIQDVPAMRELVKRGVICEHAVFMPGHILGSLAGIWTAELTDYLNPEHCFQATFDNICDRFFQPGLMRKLLPDQNLGSFHAHLKKKMSCMWDQWDLATVAGYVESWINWRERQAKFNTSSVQAYMAQGFAFALPWCDGELVRFWERVPFHLRLHRRLFKKWLLRRQSHLLAVSPYEKPLAGFLGRIYRKWIPRQLRLLRYSMQMRQLYREHPMQWNHLIPPEDYARINNPELHVNHWLSLHYLQPVSLFRDA